MSSSILRSALVSTISGVFVLSVGCNSNCDGTEFACTDRPGYQEAMVESIFLIGSIRVRGWAGGVVRKVRTIL
jgi:hypothetical protein